MVGITQSKVAALTRSPFLSAGVGGTLYSFSPLLRLQSFPRGLGKGSDAALVGGWLESVLTPVDPQTVPAACCQFDLWAFTNAKEVGTCVLPKITLPK